MCGQINTFLLSVVKAVDLLAFISGNIGIKDIVAGVGRVSLNTSRKAAFY